MRAVENFSWTVAFPADFVLSTPPKFEVFDQQGRQSHEWLTAILQPCFSYAERPKTAFLSIQSHPPTIDTGFHGRFRISENLSLQQKRDTG
jgi:hypothetical protein